MKIVFDVSYIQRKRAGYGRAAEALLRALLAADRSNEYVLHGWSLSLDDETIRSFERPGVRITTSHIPGQIKRLYWNTLRTPSLQTFTGPFDIFHAAEPLLPPVGNAAAIATLYDLAYLRHPEFFMAGVRGWDRFVRRNLESARAVIVPSESTRCDLVELLHVDSNKIVIVPPAPDGRFSPAALADSGSIRTRYGIPDRYILFVGTIEPRKNIPGLVHAYEALRRRRNDVPPLVIIGKTGWLADASIAAINESSARPHIVTPGYVADANLPEIFRRAQLFVYPSFYEGFGLPIREAMASGIPVVTADNSSLSELGRDSALLVDPKSPDAIADAMETILSDEHAALRLRTQGLARAAQYTPAASANAVLKLYKQIGGGTR